MLKTVLDSLDRTELVVTRALQNRWDRGIGRIDFSIFHQVGVAEKKAIISEALSLRSGDRSVGALVGLAIGDWVGVPLEFYDVVDGQALPQGSWDPENFSYVNPNITEKERGKVKMGQWSDDLSMALCLADSLLVCGEYNGSDARQRYWNWHAEGYNNSFRKDANRPIRTSFGLGNNIAKSMFAMIPYEKPPPIYESGSEDSEMDP